MIKPGHVRVKFDLVIATDWPVIPKSKTPRSAVAKGVTARKRQQSLSATCDFAGNFTLHACRPSGMMELDAAEWGGRAGEGVGGNRGKSCGVIAGLSQ